MPLVPHSAAKFLLVALLIEYWHLLIHLFAPGLLFPAIFFCLSNCLVRHLNIKTIEPIINRNTEIRNHLVFQYGGVMVIFIVVGFSFQTPSLLVALTIKVYSPDLNLCKLQNVYIPPGSNPL